jgi:flavin-dependent dehydrogenase
MTLRATRTLAEAAERCWDAVVVGAGPAGALTAHELARRGQAVLLVDRAIFPRAKVCGCCLNGSALAALGSAGLGGLPGRLGGVALDSFHLATAGRSVELPLPCGAAVSREAFDAALVQAAIDRGADFLPGTRAALGQAHEMHRLVCLTQGDTVHEVAARLVVAADGLGCGLLARAGLATAVPWPGSHIGVAAILSNAEHFYRPGVIWMASGADGYVGLVRLEDGRLDVAAALAPVAVRHAGGPRPVVQTILAHAGLPPPGGLDTATWRGTPGLTRQLRRVAHPRLFVLGDAAGYVEPFTGEGMAWALSAAVALAPLATAVVREWRPELARAWGRRYRLVVYRRQLVCRLASSLLRRPWLVLGLVEMLKFLPGLAAPVIALLNRPGPASPQVSQLADFPWAHTA